MDVGGNTTMSNSIYKLAMVGILAIVVLMVTWQFLVTTMIFTLKINSRKS